MRIDIFIHDDRPKLDVVLGLGRIHRLLRNVAINQERIMEINEQLLEFSRRLAAASDEIASDLKKLRDEIAAGGAVKPETLATLDANVARLEAMGVDPTEPVPPAPGV